MKRKMIAGITSSIMFSMTVSFCASAAVSPLIISYDHRKNIGSTKGMSIDALSSATVYSGPTGEKKSTQQTIRDTIKSVKKAKVFEIRVKKA